MSPNISKPSATLVPLFSKIYSPPPTTSSLYSTLFFPPPRIFTPSSFGIAKVLPFPFPTKCFNNFFLSLHATRCITLRNFLPSFPPQSPFLSVPSASSTDFSYHSLCFLCSIRNSSLLHSAFSPAVMSLHYSMQYSPYHNIRHSYTLRHSLYYYMFSIPLFYHHINCNRLAIPPTATVFCRIPRAERLYSTSSSGNTSLQSQHSISPLPSCLTHRFLL